MSLDSLLRFVTLRSEAAIRDAEVIAWKYYKGVTKYSFIEQALSASALGLFFLSVALDSTKKYSRNLIVTALFVLSWALLIVVGLESLQNDIVLARLFQRWEQEHNLLASAYFLFSAASFCVLLFIRLFSNSGLILVLLKMLGALDIAALLISAELYHVQEHRRRQHQNGRASSESEYQRRVMQLQTVELTPEHYQFLQSLDDFVSNEHLATPEEVIKRLPTYTTEKTKEQCVVCLNDFEDGEKLKVLPCFHKGHEDCIDGWLRQKNACPVCQLPADEVDESLEEK